MNKVLKIYTRVGLALMPLWFLPLVVDPMGFGKNWLWLATGLIGLVLWCVRIVLDKKPEVKWNSMLSLMFLMTLWGGVSWWRLIPGLRMRSLTDPFGMGTLIAMFAWLFLWVQTGDDEQREKQWNWLTVSGLVVAVTSLVVFLLPTSKLPLVWPKDNPLVSINQAWSLSGTLLSEAVLLALLASRWIKKVVTKIKKSESSYVMPAVAAAVLTLVLGLDIYRMFKLGWSVLDTNTAWVVAVEAFKRSPIFGAGLGNFAGAFSAYRPSSYNLTGFWSTAFTTSSNVLMQLWTEMGVIGLLLAVLMVSNLLRKKKSFGYWQMVGLAVIVFLLPVNLMGVIMVTWMMGSELWEKRKGTLMLKVGESGVNGANLATAVIVLCLTVFGGYWTYRILMGEVMMRQSLLAASKNDGTGTYNLQIKAIGNNPYLADYRRVYSQTNLALAKTLLENQGATDDDKEKASVLVQQAVREGKAAIALEQNNSSYWSNLASIYRQLIGVVDGAADWSLQAYDQAAVLDPVNPLVRLDLGGLLFAAGRYEEADRVFEQVVTNKNDFANGWYNWAYTAKQLNRIGDAVTRLTQAVALVPVDSGDYEKANQELATWKKEYDEAVKKQQELLKQQQQQQAKQPETLKTPEPLPTVNAEERVNVPAEELEPPVAPQPTTAPQE